MWRFRHKPSRTIAGAALLALASALGFAAPAHAQVKASLDFPDATMRELEERGAVSVEGLRRNGLVVTVKAEAEVQLVVLAFAIREGRVGKAWSSRLLPGDTFLDEKSLNTFLRDAKLPRGLDRPAAGRLVTGQEISAEGQDESPVCHATAFLAMTMPPAPFGNEQVG